MDIFEFGDAKLAAKDIDPLYYALHHSGWPREKLCRYTLAFVSFDLAGLACQVVDAGKKNFWDAMRTAGAGKLRGAPRRYFFPKLVDDTMHLLEKEYLDAERCLDALRGPFAQAEREMSWWPYYGPTAIFKLCDMAERVCGVPVDFSSVTPKQLMSNSMVTKGVDKAMVGLFKDGTDPAELFELMRKYRWKTKAGPDYLRKLNMQEFETILCYYSHDDGKNKHLPGMDIENIRAELTGWGKTAEGLIACLPS